MIVAAEALAAGMEIPALMLPALRLEDLLRYAEASGDYAPVHLDAAHARAMGFPDVVAHGLLVMAYLGRTLTDWKPVRQLRSFSCRFSAVTLLGDRLECTGLVAALRNAGGEQLADLDLIVRNQSGDVKLQGRATVALGQGG
jgi:acyl dehydratase